MFFPLITTSETLLPIYITGIGTQENQENVDRQSGFPEYQWTFCIAGQGLFNIDGETYTITPGMGFYFVKDHPHDYHATLEPWTTQWITFNGPSTDIIFHQMNLGTHGIFQIPESDCHLLSHPIVQRHHLLYEAISQAEVGTIVDYSANLFALLLEMKSLSIKNCHTKLPDSNNLVIALDYMKVHFHEDLPLEVLSDLVGVTTEHFCRTFKKQYGLTPVQYLMRLRIQRAKQLLLTRPPIPLKAIAGKVGYQDLSYFGALFKKMESITPGQFRKVHGM